MVRALVNQIRPHQLVHQLAVLVVLSGFLAAEPLRIAAAVGISAVGTLAMLLFSDYRHRHDDAAMGRRRLVHVLGAGRVAMGIASSFVALVVLAAVMGGMRCVASLLGVFGGTAVYTLAKQRRRAIVAYLGRFAAGVLLVGTYRAAFPEVDLPAVTRLAIAAGLLDLAGNLAGDLRDEVEDRRAGLWTLPLWVGGARTRRIIVVLVLAAHAVMAGAAPAGALAMSAVVSATVVLAALLVVSRRWQHAAVHGPKLMSLLFIGAALSGAASQVLWIACAAIGVLWLSGYRAYLWSARAVMAR